MKNILAHCAKRSVNLILSKHRFFLYCALLGVMLSGCARAPIPTPLDREQTAKQLAQRAGWQLSTINTSYFSLATFLPKNIAENKTLTIYIEGDGFAYQTTTTISSNPTPISPVALQLALKHPAHLGAAAYLARPCQYVSGMQWKTCSQSDWTSHRYSANVIKATNQAIDELKQRFAASDLILVGYSGGGAVATLIAAQRHDVIRLVTVAGNLDIKFWAKQNRFKPLAGSLNPAEQWSKLVMLPQTHFAGENDTAVRPDVAYSYAKHFPADAQPTIRVIPEFDHGCCWARDWPRLFK